MMKYIDIKDARLAYRVFGSGKINIVVETALNSCSAEWWHIGQELSEEYTVLVYDRPGYGTSSASQLERTPEHTADELFQLISKLDTDKELVFIGHSQGGLYVQQFARLHPELVKGVILIDPLSANDNTFKTLLTPDEYKKSGVDKLQAYKIGKILTTLKLGFLFKPLLKKAPPFYYYPHFSRETTKYILSALTKPKQYQTAIEEYILSHKKEAIENLKSKSDFPEVPIILITHTSAIAIEESMYYGDITKELAEKVEGIWQDLMKEYLSFSNNSKLIQAEKSGHYVHLSEPEILFSALSEIMKHR